MSEKVDYKETEPFTMNLIGCARCNGEGHADLTFQPLDIPAEFPDGSVMTHWAACPTNGQPIMMFHTDGTQVVEIDLKMLEEVTE